MSNEIEANDLNSLTNKFVSTIFKSNYKTQECVKQQFQVIKALNERVAELEKKIIGTQKMEENSTNNNICNEGEPEASDTTQTPIGNQEYNITTIVARPSDSYEEPIVESTNTVEDESEACTCNCPESAQPSEECDDHLAPIGNQECSTTDIVSPPSDSYEEPIVESTNTVEDESEACTCNCPESAQPSEECDDHLAPIGNQECSTTDIVATPSDSYEEPILEPPSTLEPGTCNCPESTHKEYDDHLMTKNENELNLEESKREQCLHHVRSTTESVEKSHLQAEIHHDKPCIINNQKKNINNYFQEQDMSSAFGNFTAEFTKHLMMSIQPMIDEQKTRENATPNEISTDVN